MRAKEPNRRKGNGGPTKVRAFRVSDELWEAILEKARADAGENVTPSDAVRRAFIAYAGQPEITGLVNSDMDHRSSTYRAARDD
jgi:hypothetical protein